MRTPHQDTKGLSLGVFFGLNHTSVQSNSIHRVFGYQFRLKSVSNATPPFWSRVTLKETRGERLY